MSSKDKYLYVPVVSYALPAVLLALHNANITNFGITLFDDDITLYINERQLSERVNHVKIYDSQREYEEAQVETCPCKCAE